MSDWTAGYVAEIGYTYGYYGELNPLRASLALISAGISPPSMGVHCELGYGQGISVNMHAAASTTQWYATDFNPSQALFAQNLAVVSKANAQLTDQSFLEFCSRADLPEFDSIGLHGIWSWVSNDNRAVIVDFIRRKLKVGGLVYISYNTLPGWSNFAPVRHLMTQHSSVMGSQGSGVVSNIKNALAFTQGLMDTEPLFDKANPQARERFAKVSAQDQNYLAHEYFNLDWKPMYFSEIAQMLTSAKVDYACSANLLDHVDTVNITDKQANFLKAVTDNTLRETVRDYMVNQQFRRDYWIKGARRLTVPEQLEAFRGLPVVLTTSESDISLKITGNLGEVTLNENIYLPIIKCLSDHQVMTVGQIEKELNGKSIPIYSLIQAVLVLCGIGHLSVAQSDSGVQSARNTCRLINSHILDCATIRSEINYLASPVTGGGIPVNRFEQLFLVARDRGLKTPIDWANFAWDLLNAQNQKLVFAGKVIASPEDNVAELCRQATIFERKRLPMLTALGVF